MAFRITEVKQWTDLDGGVLTRWTWTIHLWRNFSIGFDWDRWPDDQPFGPQPSQSEGE